MEIKETVNTKDPIFDPRGELGMGLRFTSNGHEVLDQSAFDVSSMADATKIPENQPQMLAANLKQLPTLTMVNLKDGANEIMKVITLDKASIDTLKASVSIAGKGSFNYYALNIALNAAISYSTSKAHEERQNSFLFLYARVDAHFTVNGRELRENLNEFLMESAKKYVEDKDVDAINQRYGTHFVTGYYYGRVFTLISEKDNTLNDVRRQFKMKIGGAVKPVGMKGGGSEEKSDDTEDTHDVKRGTELTTTPPDDEIGDDAGKSEDSGESTSDKTKPTGQPAENKVTDATVGLKVNVNREAENMYSTQASKYSAESIGFQMDVNDLQLIDTASSSAQIVQYTLAALKKYQPKDESKFKDFTYMHKIGFSCSHYSDYLNVYELVQINWRIHLSDPEHYTSLKIPGVENNKANGTLGVFPAGDKEHIVSVIQHEKHGFILGDGRFNDVYQLGFSYANKSLTTFFRKIEGADGAHTMESGTTVMKESEDKKPSFAILKGHGKHKGMFIANFAERGSITDQQITEAYATKSL